MDKWIALLIGWNVALTIAFWVESDDLRDADAKIAQHIVNTHNDIYKQVNDHDH